MSEPLPRVISSAQTTVVGGETLVTSGDEIHVLNETAAFIWRLCDGRHTPAEIEAALRDEYAVPPDHDAKGDISRTLADFRAKGLLADD